MARGRNGGSCLRKGEIVGEEGVDALNPVGSAIVATKKSDGMWRLGDLKDAFGRETERLHPVDRGIDGSTAVR